MCTLKDCPILYVSEQTSQQRVENSQKRYSLEVSVFIALVQLRCQHFEVGKINLKQPLEPWPLDLDNNLLACVQDSSVHLQTIRAPGFV